MEGWPWPPTRNGYEDFRHPWTDEEMRVKVDLMPTVRALWGAIQAGGHDAEMDTFYSGPLGDMEE